MTLPRLLRSLCACLVLLTLHTAHAATFSWTNTAGGNWNVPSNWSPNNIPASGDTVYITNAGNYAVTVNVAATLGGLFVGANSGSQTVRLSSVTLTLNGGSVFGTNSVFEYSGGTFDGTGSATFSGLFTWSGGTMNGTGRTVFTNSATVLLNGGSKIHYARLVENYATVTWSAGAIASGFSGVWNNYGTFDIAADVAAVFQGGSALFNNSGLLRKTGGAGAAAFGYTVNNASTVSSLSGTLQLTLGGTNTGVFNTSAGTTFLDFAGGTHQLNAGSGFSGGGNFRINGGNLNFNVPVLVAPAFEVVSGTLDGPSSAIFSGLFTWSGGTMNGTGRTVFTNSATVLLNGGSKIHYARLVENYATVTWSAGALASGFSGVWNNYGTFDIAADVAAVFQGGSALFNNSGLLRKTGGAGAAAFGYTVNNASTVSSLSGTLQLTLGGTNTGVFNTSAGTTFLDFAGGTHQLNAGSGFSGGGNFRVNGGDLNFNVPVLVAPAFEVVSGTLDGPSSAIFSGLFTWSGGTMNGTGRTVFTNSATVLLNGGSKIHYARLVENYATVTWSAGALASGFSGVWNNYGTFDIAADVAAVFQGGSALFNNSGLLRKTGGAGAAAFGYTVNNASTVSSLSGTLQLTLGGTNTGVFNTSAGTTFLDFAGGTHQLNAGSGFSGGGNFRINGGNLNFNVPVLVAPAFEVVSGTLDGPSSAIFSGLFTWSGGSMNGTGRTVFTNSATVLLNGGSKIHYARLVENYATVTWSAGAIASGFSGVWNNYGTFDIAADVAAVFQGGTALFNNSGQLRKTGGAGAAAFGYTVNNASTVSSLSGTLQLTLGGTNTGVFNTSAGTTFLDFAGGTHQLNAGSGFSGGGNFRVNGGDLNFNVPIVVAPAFEVVSGTLDGPSSAIFSGLFTWSGGNMNGTGRTVFTNSATVLLNGGSKIHYARLVENYATVTWSAGAIASGFSGVWNNYGTFDIAADVAAVFQGGSAVYRNSGTLRKTGGANTASLGYSVTNSGTVRSQSGVLDFPLGYVQTAGVTELAGGRFAGTTMDIRGGVLTGSGNVAANVINGGQVAPGTGVGRLTISNNVAQTYTSTSNSVLALQIGGLAPGTQHDQLRVNGNATIAGTLRVELTNGYVPTLGNAYTVMTFAARSGQFTNFVFPDYDFAVLHTTTNIILIASNAFPAVTLDGVPTNHPVCKVFTMSSRAFDLEAGLTNLSFLIGGGVVHSVANPVNNQRYAVRVAVDYPGPVTLTARAMDNKGGIRESNVLANFFMEPLHVITPGGVLTNTFRLCMLGETGQTYSVFATTNIATPGSNWVNLGGMELLTNGPLRFVDTNYPAQPWRFYRVGQD